MQELYYKVERVTGTGEKIAKFTEISYGSALFKEEQDGLQKIRDACEKSGVTLFCTPKAYDQFLNVILFHSIEDCDTLTARIQTMKSGDYLYDGRFEFRPLILCTPLDGVCVPPEYKEDNGVRLYKMSLMFFDKAPEVLHRAVLDLKDIMKERKVEFLVSISTFKQLFSDTTMLEGFMDRINRLDSGEYTLCNEIMIKQCN